MTAGGVSGWCVLFGGYGSTLVGAGPQDSRSNRRRTVHGHAHSHSAPLRPDPRGASCCRRYCSPSGLAPAPRRPRFEAAIVGGERRLPFSLPTAAAAAAAAAGGKPLSPLLSLNRPARRRPRSGTLRLAACCPLAFSVAPPQAVRSSSECAAGRLVPWAKQRGDAGAPAARCRGHSYHFAL